VRLIAHGLEPTIQGLVYVMCFAVGFMLGRVTDRAWERR